MILSHAAICICVAFERGAGLTISEPQVACPREIAEDPLDGLPVSRPRVGSKASNCHDCKCDVRSCRQCGPVKGANGLVVGDIAHHHALCCACGCLV